MKKNVKHIAIAVLIIVGIYSCKELTKVSQQINLPDITAKDCLGCKSYGFGQSDKANDGTSNLEGLNKYTATVMANNYKSNCWNVLSKNLAQDDALSVWFSIETLKEFIYNIEKANCNNSCKNALNLGVRIYYARYPESVQLNTSNVSNNPSKALYDDLNKLLLTEKPNYQKKHTIFFVPTYDLPDPKDDNNPFHIDFDPWHMGGDCNNPTPITAFDSIPAFNSLILAPQEKQISRPTIRRVKAKGVSNFDANAAFQNHGGLVPPDKPTGKGF